MWYKFVLIACGIIVFSPLGSRIMMNYFDFSFSFPELLFIPFSCLLYKRIRKYFILDFVLLLKLLYLLIVLFFITIIVDTYALSAVLSSLRSYVLLVGFFSFFIKSEGIELDDLLCISIGTIIGWIISSIYGIADYLAFDSNAVAVCGNMLGIPLAIAISLLQKQYKTFFLVLLLCVCLSLVAGMRRQIFVFVESLFLVFLFCQKRVLLKVLSIVGLFVCVFIAFFDSIGEFLKENIPVLYYRVFEKILMLFEGELQEGDERRTGHFTDFILNLDHYMFPRGFVSRNFVKDDTGKFIDFPLSELFYMIGGFGSILLLLLVLFTAYKCYVNYQLTKKNQAALMVILSIIMFSLLFIEGTFLSSSYTVPFTGYCLAQLFYYSNIKKCK